MILSPDVKLVQFDHLPFRYNAGQFLTFIFNSGKEEIRRSFSLSSCPDLNEPPSICVKRIPNGVFTRYIHDDAKPGDELLCIGASGFFTLPDEVDDFDQFYFFAAGTGIAPILPLIKKALFFTPINLITLVYSTRSIENALFKNELDRLKDQFPNRFEIRMVSSETNYPLQGRLQRLLLDKILAETMKANVNQTLFYLCGPIEYMRMISFSLRTLFIPEKNIRTEQFHQIKSATLPEPPDKNSHGLQLEMNNRQYAITVQYPDTILKAAKRNGISIPYSCEFGRCGTCVAKCTSGKVWMSNNEVLTDTELNQGLILTCVGYLLSDAEIEIS